MSRGVFWSDGLVCVVVVGEVVVVVLVGNDGSVSLWYLLGVKFVDDSISEMKDSRSRSACSSLETRLG